MNFNTIQKAEAINRIIKRTNNIYGVIDMSSHYKYNINTATFDVTIALKFENLPGVVTFPSEDALISTFDNALNADPRDITNFLIGSFT